MPKVEMLKCVKYEGYLWHFSVDLEDGHESLLPTERRGGWGVTMPCNRVS